MSEELHQGVTRALTRGLTEYMQGRYPRLPALSWSISLPLTMGDSWVHITGMVPSDCTEDEARVYLQQWGRALCLQQVSPTQTQAGLTEYVGMVDRQELTVWGVTDRAAFESAGLVVAPGT